MVRYILSAFLLSWQFLPLRRCGTYKNYWHDSRKKSINIGRTTIRALLRPHSVPLRTIFWSCSHYYRGDARYDWKTSAVLANAKKLLAFIFLFSISFCEAGLIPLFRYAILSAIAHTQLSTIKVGGKKLLWLTQNIKIATTSNTRCPHPYRNRLAAKSCIPKAPSRNAKIPKASFEMAGRTFVVFIFLIIYPYWHMRGSFNQLLFNSESFWIFVRAFYTYVVLGAFADFEKISCYNYNYGYECRS